MTRHQIFWLIPILFALHSLEEAVTIGHALPALRARLPHAAEQITAAALTATQFRLLLALLTAVPFVIVLTGRADRPGSRRGFILLAIQATLLLNALSHAATAVVAGGYVPGLLTALLVNLPFSVYVFRRGWRERWYPARAFAWLAVIAIALHGPLLIGAILLLRAIVSSA